MAKLTNWIVYLPAKGHPSQY